MGLPLFVAPVESDLSSKAADNNGSATSPSRSGIRRNARLDSRERRAALRRHMSIRDRMSNGTLRQSSTLSGREGREGPPPPPWAEHPSRESEPPAADAAQPPGYFRQVLMDAARSGGERRRAQLEEQINVIFSSAYPREDSSSGLGEDENQDSSLGWWTFDTRPRYTRARIINTGGTQQERIDDRPRSRQRISPLVQQVTFPSSSTEPESRRRATDGRTRVQTSSDTARGARSRGAALQRARGVDGLGDRDRSVSPEVWDTLLSTLTPDPQPPSAGSSFASTVASQSAGASSNTTLTTPNAAENAAIDQACESGCEDPSDTEMLNNNENIDSTRSRRRREEMRRVRVRVPDFTLDGPLDGPFSRPPRSPNRRAGSDGPVSRRPRRRPDDTSALRPSVWHSAPYADNDTGRPLSVSPFRDPPEWVGHFSVGNSDDEQPSDYAALNRESSAVLGGSTSTGEEEWAGWQHIVRSLARREDIPDEWWADAGLSRMFPQSGTD